MFDNLVVRNLTKQYSNGKGIAGVSFACPEGSFTVLLGPSGAGKTTTVSLIAGILQQTSGDVLIRGQSLERVSPRERQVAMAFEDYALYPTHTVYENIASPLRVRKMGDEEIDRRVRSMAALLGIDQHLDKLPSQISGGQKQRTGLCRCLVRDADVYILDEPIAHLDAKLRHRMRGEFKRIHRELGKTMIYVSHDFREALALADTIVILDAGRVVQIGTPQEVFTRPRNTFVATLLGDPPMNLVDFEAARVSNGHLSLESPRGPVGIDGTLFTDAGLGRVRLGFRDFAVSLQAERAPNCLAGSVYVSEPIEDRKVFTISVGENRVKVLTARSVDLPINREVFIQLNPKRIHLFDAQSGERIPERA